MNLKLPLAVAAFTALGLHFALHGLAVEAGGKNAGRSKYPVPGGRTDDAPASNASAGQATGYFTGAFGPNKITVRIEKIVGESVLGYSIVAGNERAFSGTARRLEDGAYLVKAREPGDNKYDGAFEFRVERGFQVLRGTWQPYDPRMEPKSFALQRRSFRYDPKIGEFPQSSTRLLTTTDVENLDQETLRLMRNAIYARHGYSFKMRDIREIFDTKDWYMPMSTDIAAQLTPIEQKNAALLKRYEKYAAEYYDSFGR